MNSPRCRSGSRGSQVGHLCREEVVQDVFPFFSSSTNLRTVCVALGLLVSTRAGAVVTPIDVALANCPTCQEALGAGRSPAIQPFNDFNIAGLLATARERGELAWGALEAPSPLSTNFSTTPKVSPLSPSTGEVSYQPRGVTDPVNWAPGQKLPGSDIIGPAPALVPQWNSPELADFRAGVKELIGFQAGMASQGFPYLQPAAGVSAAPLL